MSKSRFNRAVLPSVAVVLPLAAEAVRAGTTNARLWLWGDQALIDIEAHNSLLGRNLLGVYDRYGWHHLGPIWLLLLGVFRFIGGGSPLSLVIGNYVLEAVWAVAIVLVVNRLRPGLAAWWAALLVVGFEWCFGLDRLGTVWAPYAVALPAALLVLLVADVATNDNPWPSTVAAVFCASFLCQTEISTSVMAIALLAAMLVLHPAVGGWARTTASGRVREGRGSALGWSKRWRLWVPVLATVVALTWLAPVVQQLSTSPGNLTQVYDFLTTHAAHHSSGSSLRALDTIFGSYPFRLGALGGSHDANARWLVAASAWGHPWYALYVCVTFLAAALAFVRRQQQAFALATASLVALLGAGWSVHLVYGPVYPYLVFWMVALAVPAWVSCWLAVAPSPARAKARQGPSVPELLGVPVARGAQGLSWASLLAAVLVGSAFVAVPVPMTGVPSRLGRESWEAVASAVASQRVKTVYVDMAGIAAMPEAAAIADQAVRHGRRVELNAAALYFLDPSFARRGKPQVVVVVCCGRGDQGDAPRGFQWRAKVGGQDIYTSPGASTGP